MKFKLSRRGDFWWLNCQDKKCQFGVHMPERRSFMNPGVDVDELRHLCPVIHV